MTDNIVFSFYKLNCARLTATKRGLEINFSCCVSVKYINTLLETPNKYLSQIPKLKYLFNPLYCSGIYFEVLES